MGGLLEQIDAQVAEDLAVGSFRYAKLGETSIILDGLSNVIFTGNSACNVGLTLSCNCITACNVGLTVQTTTGSNITTCGVFSSNSFNAPLLLQSGQVVALSNSLSNYQTVVDATTQSNAIYPRYQLEQ